MGREGEREREIEPGKQEKLQSERQERKGEERKAKARKVRTLHREREREKKSRKRNARDRPYPDTLFFLTPAPFTLWNLEDGLDWKSTTI